MREKVEGIKKNMRTWDWGCCVFKLYCFEERGRKFCFL